MMGMASLRHSLKAFTAAILAVVAVMIVTTAATAESPPERPSMMSMTGQGSCDDMKGGDKVPCTPHCAVLCQALIGSPSQPLRTPVWSQARYDETSSILTGVAHEADDPPPRVPIR